MSGKTGTTESHRSSGFVGFTNHYAAANYIFADSSTSVGHLFISPARRAAAVTCIGGNEPARTWFEAMKPIATDFGDVHLPPTDPRYVDGAPGGRVPSVSGLKVDAARQRLKDAGFQVADQPTSVNSSAPYGAVVGTTPSGQTFPGSIITINISNGIPPAPPPPPVERPAGSNRVAQLLRRGADGHGDSGAAADHRASARTAAAGRTTTALTSESHCNAPRCRKTVGCARPVVLVRTLVQAGFVARTTKPATGAPASLRSSADSASAVSPDWVSTRFTYARLWLYRPCSSSR